MSSLQNASSRLWNLPRGCQASLPSPLLTRSLCLSRPAWTFWWESPHVSPGAVWLCLAIEWLHWPLVLKRSTALDFARTMGDCLFSYCRNRFLSGSTLQTKIQVSFSETVFQLMLSVNACLWVSRTTDNHIGYKLRQSHYFINPFSERHKEFRLWIEIFAYMSHLQAFLTKRYKTWNG